MHELHNIAWLLFAVIFSSFLTAFAGSILFLFLLSFKEHIGMIGVSMGRVPGIRIQKVW